MNLSRLNQVDPPSGQEVLWCELCKSFPDEPRLAELRSAACRRLPARHPLSIARKPRETHSITIEAPSGAAVSLLPAAASDLLPLPVTSREGVPATDASTCHVEITCLAEGDHGIPHGEASLIQRCSETRLWSGGAEYLDPFLVLEALRVLATCS